MKYPNAASAGAWLSSGGWEVSHPGLVVSEGSVFSSLCAAGLTGEQWAPPFWRMCMCLLCCGGTGHWHSSSFKSKVWGRNEDWCPKNGVATHRLRYPYIIIYTCTRHLLWLTAGVHARYEVPRVFVSGRVSSVIRGMWFNCIWSPNKPRISPSPWRRWQMWWTSASASRTTLNLLKIIDLLFASQVGDK